jgi:hypothetical protein
VSDGAHAQLRALASPAIRHFPVAVILLLPQIEYTGISPSNI